MKPAGRAARSGTTTPRGIASGGAQERMRGRRRSVCAMTAGVLILAVACRAEEPRIPPPQGFVNDFAHVLDDATIQQLDALIRDLRAKTGAEIAVVTVASTQPLSAFDYAMKIAESWKPGAAGKDNGVVFLVAVKDREMFILTGYGVEGALPDGRVGEIRDRLVVPYFRRGDYSGGIRAGTEEIAAILAQEYGVTLSGRAAGPRTALPARQAPPLLLLIVILIIIIFLWRTGLWPLLFRPQRGHRRYGDGFGGGFGGGGFGGGGGGFGGFGGGGFGGGGAGGRW